MAGLYFEDFTVGQSMTTKGRTVTETDIVQFAGLSGDFNPLHTDEEYARGTEFGHRIAHGALGFSIATGLSNQLGFLDGTAMGLMEVTMKFRAPIYCGDTIHCELIITDLKPMRRLGGGLVTLGVKIVKQDGTVTQKGEWVVLVRLSPQHAAASES